MEAYLNWVIIESFVTLPVFGHRSQNVAELSTKFTHEV